MSHTSEEKNCKSPSRTTQVPRKRRKRTVVTGAADDCFTCARRGVPCDRRRPYCSQCLENNQGCSGYKTTLTWGVGVASRGKFRGLSLPVKGAQPAAAPLKPQDSIEPQKLSQLGPDSASIPDGSAFYIQLEQPSSTLDTDKGAALTSVPSPQVPLQPGSGHIAVPNNPVSFNPSIPYCEGSNPLTDPHSIPNASCGWGTESCDPLMQSPAVLAEWSYSPYPQDTTENDSQEAPKQASKAVQNSSFLATYHSPSFSQLLLARSVGRTPRLRYLISYYAEVIAPVIVAFDSPTNPFRTSILRLAQESTSLQEAIATLSTSNLRQRRERGVMSTGRTAPARMSSLAHCALTDKAYQEWYNTPAPEGFAREEQFHRYQAVNALNMELADPQRMLSDSVLATLLILCLFHICDTGVAQFKTQFAGVTKLLAIRMRNSSYLSDDLKWFIRIFTWYDTMAATTNDREIQLHNPCVEVTAVSDDEWSLENLAGCDAGLFKLVSQLGRLNILSQSQEASDDIAPNIFPPTTVPPPFMAYSPSDLLASGFSAPADPYAFPLPTPLQAGEQTKQPLSPVFWAEWFSIRQQLDSWRLPRQRPQSEFPFETDFVVSPSMAEAYISPPSSPLSQCRVAPQNVEDVFHISQSFRHSAILYSERLAYPDIPSSHPRIQQIVHRSIAHILAVKSDVYLLWPLFITGSECVLEEHRLIIRERCKDISKDSGFYNNLSCLELLEKIWAVNLASPVNIESDFNSIPTSSGCGTYVVPVADGMPTSPRSWSAQGEAVACPASASSNGTKCHGFRWQKVMQAKRAEGEYMVA